MSGCVSIVSQAIAQWFISDPEKIKIIAQCSFYLNPDLKTLTIDCREGALQEMKALTGEMGESMAHLEVVLIRLTCQGELISQFSPDHAIYFYDWHQRNHQRSDTE